MSEGESVGKRVMKSVRGRKMVGGCEEEGEEDGEGKEEASG